MHIVVVSDHHSERIADEEAAPAQPAVIRHPDLVLFKRSLKLAAEVFDV